MGDNIRIMIVDDEERFLNTLAQRLRLRDFDVAAFSNGQEAVEAARSREFDLAIVDLKMPGMTGEQVLEIIKNERPLTEVIILTGHGSIPSAVHCTQVGSYNYLQKPCETDELLEVLKNAYQRRVQKKLKIDQEKMEKMLDTSLGESPLGILRRLRDIDKG
ncbi:MAG: response regulator [Deltaproteobacteria bacterium]|nr:response regulator [Deltaproteobacteria bacterium]